MSTPTHSNDLSDRELVQLVERVFAPQPNEHRLAVLVDLPDAALADHPAWAARRALALGWAQRLAALHDETGLDASLIYCRNARRNNADLPEVAWRLDPRTASAPPPTDADALDAADAVPFETLFDQHAVWLAPTELSATAPLKLAAQHHGFRAATMPGFSSAMVQALRIDYTEVQRQVDALARRLDDAAGADFTFGVDGRSHSLHLDLRHRTGHASGGLLHTPGTAGNLPSGEAYIVPYEGERPGDVSRSAGTLPVQFGDDVVYFTIDANRATTVTGTMDPGAETDTGAEVERQRAWLAAEPAYGNMAELGLGVLEGFGVAPIGETLLDEKLGLHIAFGRSDHFGGQVGARDFSRPDAVVHIDRVYIRATQPRVTVERVDLIAPDGAAAALMRNGRYV